MLATFWDYRSPTLAMVKLGLLMDCCSYGPLFGLLLVSSRVIQLLGCAYYESSLQLSPGALRSRRRFMPWLLLIVVGGFFLIHWRVPMQVAFWVSRPAMDRLADQALADPANAHWLAGQWAGVSGRTRGVTVLRVSRGQGGPRSSTAPAQRTGLSTSAIFPNNRAVATRKGNASRGTGS